jgi:hypothetical protein
MNIKLKKAVRIRKQYIKSGSVIGGELLKAAVSDNPNFYCFVEGGDLEVVQKELKALSDTYGDNSEPAEKAKRGRPQKN